jgi:phosphatidylinositol-4,5-bisphosphate 3-kinase
MRRHSGTDADVHAENGGSARPPLVDYLDIVFWDNRRTAMPLILGLKGRDLVSQLRAFDLGDYCICRQTHDQARIEILHVEGDDCVDLTPVQLPADFYDCPLASLVHPTNATRTCRQRHILFVNSVERQREIDQEMAMGVQFLRRTHRVMNVELPTGMVMDVTVDASMEEPGAMRDAAVRRMASVFPPPQEGGPWLKEPEYYELVRMERWPEWARRPIGPASGEVGLRQQRWRGERPMYRLQDIRREGAFVHATEQLARDLNMPPQPATTEGMNLRWEAAQLRHEAAVRRQHILEREPLDLLTRVTEWPPLTSYYRDRPSASDRVMIVRVALPKGMARLSSLTVRDVPFDIPANRLVERALAVIVEKDPEAASRARLGLDAGIDNPPATPGQNGVGVSLWAEEYAFVLSGVDEVLSGDVPICNFAGVREFVTSAEKMDILSLDLVGKEILREKMLQRQVVAFPEPSLEELQTRFALRGGPVGFVESPRMNSCDVRRTGLTVLVMGFVNLVRKRKESFCGFCKVALIYGSPTIGSPHRALLVEARLPATGYVHGGSDTVLLNQRVELMCPACNVPRGSRLVVSLFERAEGGAESAIATVNVAVYDGHGVFDTSVHVCSMWRGVSHPGYHLPPGKSAERDGPQAKFALIGYALPLVHALVNPGGTRAQDRDGGRTRDRQKLIGEWHPLQELSERERGLIMGDVGMFLRRSGGSSMVLDSVDLWKVEDMATVPYWLEESARGVSREGPARRATDALLLLSHRFADPGVREHAVSLLVELSDEHIALYMLQLVQALEFELYEDNALIHFLLARAFREPRFLGHALFWQLASKLHNPRVRRRFAHYIVHLLLGMDAYRDELIQGWHFVSRLASLQRRLLSETGDGEARTVRLRQELAGMQIPTNFHLPVNPRVVVDQFVLSGCRVMASKQAPLRLRFRNASKSAPHNAQVVGMFFKVGDDLRQDQLVMQVLRTMDDLWRREGEDYCMTAYGVLPTAERQGLVEEVPDSVTETHCLLRSGVLSSHSIYEYLRSNYLGSDPAFDTVVRQRFRRSQAGYAVATAVLGIADRHPSNVMIQSTGRYYHIDFGHFLGNYKTKGGIQREGESVDGGHVFHFTPAMAEMIGREKWSTFERECRVALTILRRNMHLLEVLLLQLVTAGLPELRSPSDVSFMTKALYRGESDEAAGAMFSRLLEGSRRSMRTLLNNKAHVLKMKRRLGS